MQPEGRRSITEARARRGEAESHPPTHPFRVRGDSPRPETRGQQPNTRFARLLLCPLFMPLSSNLGLLYLALVTWGLGATSSWASASSVDTLVAAERGKANRMNHQPRPVPRKSGRPRVKS